MRKESMAAGAWRAAMAREEQERADRAGLSPAEVFFYDNAGWAHSPGQSEVDARRKGARRLARAEALAAARGYSFRWDVDPDVTSTEWLHDRAPEVVANGGHWRTWFCVMVAPGGDVVDSLGGVDFGPGGEPWGAPYARVVQAEMATEYLAREDADNASDIQGN